MYVSVGVSYANGHTLHALHRKRNNCKIFGQSQFVLCRFPRAK